MTYARRSIRSSILEDHKLGDIEIQTTCSIGYGRVSAIPHEHEAWSITRRMA